MWRACWRVGRSPERCDVVRSGRQRKGAKARAPTRGGLLLSCTDAPVSPESRRVRLSALVCEDGGTGCFCEIFGVGCPENPTDPRGSYCTATVLFKQGTPAPWAHDTYDHIMKTIGLKGCALTSLAMALNGGGIALDPGTANAALRTAPDSQFKNGGMIWDKNTKFLSAGAFRFDNKVRDKAKMRQAICDSAPVILGVKLAPPFSHARPGHFVLATNAITARPEMFQVIASNAVIDVADPQGRRAVADPLAAPITGIPGSSADVDALDDDETGEIDTTSTSTVSVDSPAAGTYRVTVTPLFASTDMVLVDSYATTANADMRHSMRHSLPYSVGGRVPLVFDLAIKADGASNVALAATGQVTLTYMCGNRFRVRNVNGFALQLRWDVYKTADQGAVAVPGRPAGSAFSEVFFSTATPGTVRLFQGASLVQTKANGGKSC